MSASTTKPEMAPKPAAPTPHDTNRKHDRQCFDRLNQRTKKCRGNRRSGMQADHGEFSGRPYPILSINEVFRWINK
jgi:hypothetical protein